MIVIVRILDIDANDDSPILWIWEFISSICNCCAFSNANDPIFNTPSIIENPIDENDNQLEAALKEISK